MSDYFINGSAWLRADFHLHTNADQEFTYSGESNSYVTEYINGLKASNISLGIITNHNKFDMDEYKALKKKARKEEICLLPGVELSVNDGANGIHTIVVFSDQWLDSGNDYISPFITTMFPGKSEKEYQTENGRSDKNILQVVEELEKTSRSYFIIFAHVNQKSGLWEEMKGGKLSDFASKRYDIVRKRTLAFQKVRSRDDQAKVKGWLEGWYPAEVEGSDCKSIEEIGKGEACWLKIGDFSFEAVMYALRDEKNRLSSSKPSTYTHSYIKSVSFEGGVLDNQTVQLSPELNTLIGIRGSGKSSIIESIRYCLDIPFGDKVIDDVYKKSLVNHTLGSGGKVILHTVDQHQQEFTISRVLNQSPEVFQNNKLLPGISIRETVIHKPIYFGQKDLSSTGEGFEKDLVEKIVGEKLNDVRRRISEQQSKVIDISRRYSGLSSVTEKIQEYQQKKLDSEFRLKIYKDNGIQDKLQKQTDFNTDQRKISQIIADSQQFSSAISQVITQYEDELNNHLLYKSKQNNEYFEAFFETYKTIISAFEELKLIQEKCNTAHIALQQKSREFDTDKQNALEEFAEIRRKLESDLRSQGKTLNLEEFPNLQKNIEVARQMLKDLTKQQSQGQNIYTELVKELSILNSLWLEEFKLIENELKKVNEKNTSLIITGNYKGNKESFSQQLVSTFKGSRINTSTLTRITAGYADLGEIFKDFENVKTKAGSSPEKFEEFFMNSLPELLTWQVPNQFVIKYRGKELKHHSLGQRASALMLFVLSQQENDMVLIDQPEDDLDNQTIYEDVIKLIKQLKPTTQFIFATHNANFPVLGDAEQIHSCRYEDDAITLRSGNIDSQTMQTEIIDIMEGGEDAFNRRKEIYQIWKPQNS